jgi:hypothetical protein
MSPRPVQDACTALMFASAVAGNIVSRMRNLPPRSKQPNDSIGFGGELGSHSDDSECGGELIT